MLTCSVRARACFFSDMAQSKVTKQRIFGHRKWPESNSRWM